MMRHMSIARLVPPCILLLTAGCAAIKQPASLPPEPPPQAASSAPAPAEPFAGRFADVTQEAGIRFTHVNGASGRKWLPETMGSGVVVFDADGDGAPDLFFVNSRRWQQDPKGPAATPALYRNLGGMRFEDVTKQAGLGVELFGMGATAGDMDSDGDADLFVTALGPDRLFRNDGGGRFTDVTRDAGIADDDWGTSATWLDADRDGDLDVFVANYVAWTEENDLRCTLDGVNKSYCTPESYAGASPRLWSNEGGGRFTDATERMGLRMPTAKSLGVVAVDEDGDGLVDIVVANDTQPNYLFRAQADGTFREEGVVAGIGYGETGLVRAGMGIDAGDFDGSGRPSLVIGNFSNEMIALYRNEGHGLFVDAAPATGVGEATLLTLAFGCLFLDADLDGREDLFVANGHIDPEITHVQPQVSFAESPHLLRQLPDGRFEDVAKQAGEAFASPKVGRGAACGDLDGDGDLDLVMTQNGGPARVYRNDLPAGAAWLRVDLRGRAPREAWGARVRLTAGGATQSKFVRAGSAYLSQSERIVTFGLGGATAVEKLEVRWPSGRTTTHDVPSLRTTLVIEEPAPQ